MRESLHKLRIFADYFQFVLMDEKSEDDFSEIWTDEALARMLAVGDCAACPGTLRNVDVDVEIEVLPEEPEIDTAKWDNITEGSIRIPSGKLVVMGCTDYLPDAMRIELEAGNYQFISLAGGTDSIEDESEPADDLYKVVLWPGPLRGPRLIKSWKHGDT